MIELPEDAIILVCLSTDEAAADHSHIVRGSYRTPCDDCGRDCWRAPGPAFASLDADEKRLQILSPFAPQPTPTVVLCTMCARAHYLLNHGINLPEGF